MLATDWEKLNTEIFGDENAHHAGVQAREPLQTRPPSPSAQGLSRKVC